MAYNLLILHSSWGVQRGAVVVEGQEAVVSACGDVPVIVGITLEPKSSSPELVRRFLKGAQTLRTFVRRFQHNMLLALRATMA